MPNTDFHAVFHGLSLGAVPLAYSAEIQALADELFPHHHVTLVHRGQEVQVLIHPGLSKAEQERWEELLDELLRELEAEELEG
jgi:hypothetical protein